MEFEWTDYSTEDSKFIDLWLDDAAAAMTGIDQGWDGYWNAVIADAENYPGCKDFCKIVRENGVPVAVVAFGFYRGNATISEIVVDPLQRSKGYGARIIYELISHSDTWIDEEIVQFDAVVFPNNLPSQKAFQKAGFVLEHEDKEALNYVYKR